MSVPMHQAEAPDDTEVQRSPQNCVFLVWNFFMASPWALEFGDGFYIFGKYVDPCSMYLILVSPQNSICTA